MEDGWSKEEVVSSLMGRLSDDLGARVSLGDTGACILDFEDEVSISIEVPEDGQILHVYAKIERCPPDKRAIFIEEALCLNMYGTETGGGALALDRDSDTVILCLSQPLELLDEYHLLAIVDGFVGLVPDLRERLRSLTNGRDRGPSNDIPRGPNVIVA